MNFVSILELFPGAIVFCMVMQDSLISSKTDIYSFLFFSHLHAAWYICGLEAEESTAFGIGLQNQVPMRSLSLITGGCIRQTDICSVWSQQIIKKLLTGWVNSAQTSITSSVRRNYNIFVLL